MSPAAESSASKRREAALAGHRGDEETARQALRDPDGSVRATALGALARFDRLSAVDLRSGFADPQPKVRARAAELAVRFGPAMLDDLAKTLQDRDDQVVEATCFALGELGEAAQAAVADLSRVALHHTDPLCREAAVAALGAIGSPDGLPAVLAATGDKPAIRRRAVLALAPFAGAEVDEAIGRALTDRDWQVRQAAEDLSGRIT